MIILGLIAWSIFGVLGTKVLVEEIFGEKSKVNFSPEQIGGLIFLPLGGIVTLILAFLVHNKIIDLKWDK